MTETVGSAPSSPAARNTLRMLSYLGRQRGPVPASAIARDLAMPRSATYRILAAMVDNGYVIHYPDDQRYGLGFAAYELSSGFTRQVPLSRLGSRILANLVDQIGETAHLAVLDGTDVIYLLEQRAKHRPVLITDVGVRLPGHQTASGRALLACLPVTHLRALYSGGSDFRLGDRSFASFAAMRRELVAVDRAGFAAEDGEVTEGFASVAVAFRDRAGWPAASVTVTFPRENVAPADWPELAAQITRYAGEFGRRLGG